MPRKILIVDDEPDIITFLSSVLEENGYTSVSAKDGVEGLEILRKEKPDLVLLDLMMPKKSGITMFQELRKDPDMSHIPVVVVTGVSDVTGVDFRNFMYKQPLRDEKKFAETTGLTKYTIPDGYLEKPIDPDELVKLVKEALKE
ncbi:MAG: response regulator [Deltaproteobacteria bacterium]|nr:response regulator [Deltaproteobacteria bacterium]MBW2018987.1 response regulator [Deltaproteobacteria bacterium]MBW2073577.1 response regulator [Deltaproteobacteria bacterium]RLB82708.1 MAG: response regulator [Deltaproteobacteria bacterium]